MTHIRTTVSVIMLSLFSFQLSAQTEKNYKCLIVDNDFDSLNFNKNLSDSDFNCLEINSIITTQMLNEIFIKIAQKENIEKVVLSNYSGKHLPGSFYGFNNLNQLTISACPQINYKVLFRKLKKNKNISILELDDNDLAAIPNNIKNLTSLNKVIITNYDYVNANALFKNLALLPYLKHLTLNASGRIEFNPDCIFPTGLHSLNLSDNWMPYLPKNMAKNKNLETLNISENNFKDVRTIVAIIGELPLKELNVSCYDIIDSLTYLKSFPNTKLNIAIYRDLKDSVANRNTLSNKQPVPFIENYYKNIVTPFIGNPENNIITYRVNTQKSNSFVYKTGTVVNVPENAFIDASGTPVNGEINIYYREFTDITDMLANGIRLQYDSAGENHHFQTAGMFEIYAAKDNQEIFLAPDKKIQIDFSTLDTASGYNLYKLDKKGQWQFNTLLTNDVTLTLPNPNPAYRLYSRLLTKDLRYFDDRYKDTAYARTKIIHASYYFNNRKTDFPYFKIKRASKYISDKTVKKQPSFYFHELNYGIYKELGAYRNYVWIYEGRLDKKEFAKTYLTRKKWTDIRIEYNPDEYLYDIELKNPHGFYSFKAWPYRTNMTPEKEKYDKIFLRADKRYTKSLNRTQIRFDKKLNKNLAQRQKKIWDEIHKLMTPEEKAMSKPDWIAYAQKCLERERDSLNRIPFNIAGATRSLQIDGFGIWNVDKIYKMPDRFEFLASFTDALNNPITHNILYIIDNTDKTMFSFAAANENKISIKNGSETAFFMINANGHIAIVDKNNVRNSIAASNGKNINFTAYEIDPKLLNTGDLRNLLGF